jgi:hypothetical protein
MPERADLIQHLSESAADNILQWLIKPKYEQYRDEVLSLIRDEQWQVLEDSFFKVVEYGGSTRHDGCWVKSN